MLRSDPSTPRARLRVHVLFESQDRVTPNGASFLRLIRPLEHPANRDHISLTYAATLPPDRDLDLVVVDRLWRHDLTPALQNELFETLAARKIPFVYSLDDDLISTPDTDTRLGLPSPQQRQLVRRFIQHASGTIVSTAELAKRVTPLTPAVRVIENQLDERLFRHQAATRRITDGLCFGYMGTRTHLQDLLMILQPLRRFLAENPDKVRLEIIGVADDLVLESMFENLPVSICTVPKNAIRYPEFMQWMAANLDWDFAIAPLSDDSFNATKSDLKYLDYGILGIPAIFSRGPSFGRSVEDGVTGLLADNTAESWYAALTRMLNDRPLRERLAAQVKEQVWTQRTLAQHAHRWPAALLELTGVEPRPEPMSTTSSPGSLLDPSHEEASEDISQRFFWRRAIDASRRRDHLLHFVNTSGKGLEVGPSFSPVAPKGSGYDVDVVDHATAEELRAKYKDQGVDLDAIEEVDYVWNGTSLTELLGTEPRYDYIIASHLIEHLPDLIGFLLDCQRLLRPHGVLSLAVPDFRCCFDILRGPTTTGEVLQAHLERRTRHSAGIVFDHFAYAAYQDNRPSWGCRSQGTLEFIHRFAEAEQMMKHAQHSQEYLDVHAWQFTPSSFRLLMHDLRSLGLVSMREIGGFLTSEGNEFLVTLQVSNVKPEGSRLSLAEDAVKEWGGFAC